MKKQDAIKVFENKKVRTIWDEKQEKWYFSVTDVLQILTKSVDVAAYWRKLKQRLKAEGNETVTNLHGLKMVAADGKMRITDVADTAILTDELTKAWSGFNTKQYKAFKDLKRENLRDNMTNLELVLNMLAEASTTEISKDKKPVTFTEHKTVAQKGGKVAKAARVQLENTTGKKVVTKQNAKVLAANINKKINE